MKKWRAYRSVSYAARPRNRKFTRKENIIMMREHKRMKEQKRQMLDWLREIISHEPWNEDNLTDWANQWFGLDYDNDYHEQLELGFRQDYEQGMRRIAALKPQVALYRHDPALGSSMMKTETTGYWWQSTT